MLNWLIRYAPAIEALESIGRLGSILDVGCGTHGLACVRPRQPFVGLEIAYDGEPTPTMVPFVAPAGRLPWRDAAFDTVLCLDVLEHVPAAGRSGLIAELARVAARQVLVACPSSSAQPIDDLLRERLTASGPAPAWLQEHYDCGLPDPSEVERLVRDVEGFAVEPVPMVNSVLGTMIVMGDMDPAFAGAAHAEYALRAEEWAGMLAGACFGESLRVGWRMERLAPRAALVAEDDLERDAIRAMRLPGAELMRTTASAGLELDTSARLKLWITADGSRPQACLDVLAAYLMHAPVDDSTCLCVDVSGYFRGAEAITDACSRLCGEEPFPDVLVVEAGSRAADAVPVETPGDVRAALAVS